MPGFHISEPTSPLHRRKVSWKLAEAFLRPVHSWQRKLFSQHRDVISHSWECLEFPGTEDTLTEKRRSPSLMTEFVSSSHRIFAKQNTKMEAFILCPQLNCKDFPGGSNSKESACDAGDSGSIPRSGRSPGGGNDNPLQDSCLGNPVRRGAWRGYRPWGCKATVKARPSRKVATAPGAGPLLSLCALSWLCESTSDRL